MNDDYLRLPAELIRERTQARARRFFLALALSPFVVVGALTIFDDAKARWDEYRKAPVPTLTCSLGDEWFVVTRSGRRLKVVCPEDKEPSTWGVRPEQAGELMRPTSPPSSR